MLKEIGHFIRVGKDASKLQKTMPRAEFMDHMMTKADEQGYAEVRRELVSGVTGRVLEIGCGTGGMFRHYERDAQVEAIEPEQDFLSLAIPRARQSGGRIHADAGDGMDLKFEDASFDVVVFGLVLCSVPSMTRVLAEAHRVLRPGGQLRALEHVRSEEAIPGFLMDIANPLWLMLNKQGCCWNRNPIREIEATGFHLDDVMSFKRFDTVMPAFPMRRVRGHKTAA
jgi:ubiquinone/menaquinone biosynthesis C-methylase UbiE